MYGPSPGHAVLWRTDWVVLIDGKLPLDSGLYRRHILKEFVYGTLIATRDENMNTAKFGQADEEAYELSRFLAFVERVDDEHLLGI